MSRKATLPRDHLVVTSRHSLPTVKRLDAIAARLTQTAPRLVTRADIIRLAVDRLLEADKSAKGA